MYLIPGTVYFSCLLVVSQNTELHGGPNHCSVRAYGGFTIYYNGNRAESKAQVD